MSDITLTRMTVGFEIFAISVFVWAGVDYNRFIKFWVLRPAPYTTRVRVFFRVFFLACVIGGVWQLADTVAGSRAPLMFFGSSLLFAVGWLLVFALMLHAVEKMGRKRQINSGLRDE